MHSVGLEPANLKLILIGTPTTHQSTRDANRRIELQ